MTSKKVEILEANYWENFKFANDLAMFYPIDHPKRKALQMALNQMLPEINKIKKQKK